MSISMYFHMCMHNIILELCSNTIVIAQRVACLLRKVVQEIERRISTQAEHLRNNLRKKIASLFRLIP